MAFFDNFFFLFFSFFLAVRLFTMLKRKDSVMETLFRLRKLRNRSDYYEKKCLSPLVELQFSAVV